MKVYWVFADDKYYPCGGMADFEKSFETIEEAAEYAESIKQDFDDVVVVDITEHLN